MRHIWRELARQYQTLAYQRGVDQHVAVVGISEEAVVLGAVFDVSLEVHGLTYQSPSASRAS